MADSAPRYSPRYSFDPLERRGLLLGLQPNQIAVAGAGLLAAWMALRMLPGPVGALLAVGFVVLAGAGTFWTKDGWTAASWADLSLRWCVRRLRGPLISGEPLDGTAVRDGRRVTKQQLPAEALPGIHLADLAAEPGQSAVGVVIDRRSGNWLAVVPVRGRSFSLLDPEDQARRLDSWRVALNSLGRPGTSVRRVQWIERSWPAGDSGLLGTARSVELAGARSDEAVRSYVEIATAASSAVQMHAVYLAVAVGGHRAVSDHAARKTSDTLRRELRLLEGQLRSAELWASAPLNANEIAGLLESSHSDQPIDGRRWSQHSFWPFAEDEGWSFLRAGGTWHATYWIAEWPRIEVGPDFMSPLLMSGGRRSVSLTMAPVPPDRAAREVRSARTADVAEEQLRSRAGFLSNARKDREAESAVRREEELAIGHADYRFSGYVTVSACDRQALDLACAETEHAAQAAHLEIRRLYGRQREAFTFTLPFARGLR